MPCPSILVVDPDENVRHSLAKLLHQSGYEVALAANACTAFDLLLDRPFNLICSDIILPDLDSQAFLVRIHELDPLLPILIITAYPAISMIVDIEGCQRSRYLLKPVDPILLLESVVQVLRSPGKS